MYTLGHDAPIPPAYAHTATLPAPLGLVELRLPGDPTRMNWLRPDHPYAAVVAPPALAADVAMTCDEEQGTTTTTVTLTNTSTKPVLTAVGDIGITLPLEDRYYDESADYDVRRHCDVHLNCAGACSWVLALRMSGDAPHLGLVLTEGALASYSVSRDVTRESNDRGCFVLHPEPMAFAPGKSRRLSWTTFPCAGRDDFFEQAARHSRFIRADWDRTVLFAGEGGTLTIRPSFEASSVTVNGQPARRVGDGVYEFRYRSSASDVWSHDRVDDRAGEHVFRIDADGRTLITRVFVSAPLEDLLARRAAFIVGRQQSEGDDPHLDGAYLPYDNEGERRYYYAGTPVSDNINDYNAGRERAGMGLFLASYLRALREGRLAVPEGDPEGLEAAMEHSLDAYRCFVLRELVDADSGQVFNDAPRDDSFVRLYNSPWYAALFLEFHRLDGRAEDLLTAYRIIRDFYAHDALRFYPIEMPVLVLCEALEQAGMTREFESARAMFVAHARSLAGLGLNYPKHEVNFEQSIVAPAAQLILQTALLTGDADLAKAGLDQLRVLDQFNGCQPDAHLNEVAIRHWDGFWFGKRKQYGDTFPHYWSGLTGDIFDLAALLAEREGAEADLSAAQIAEYHRRAEASLRANLQLFFPDGRASAAYVFPYSVNGVRTHFADPMANDQDWALYFMLRRR